MRRLASSVAQVGNLRRFRPITLIDPIHLVCPIITGLILLSVSGCATKPFNIKPRQAAQPGNFTARAAAGAMEVQAGVIRDEDYLYSTFDSNMILAGVIPIKLCVHNAGSGAIDLKDVHFMLDPCCQEPIHPRHAFKRLIAYYKIRIYNPAGYKASLADFVSYGFDQRTPLRPGESRWGVLFFEDSSAQQQASGFALLVKGIGKGELKLSLD